MRPTSLLVLPTTLGAILLGACHASATVQNTMPVANLQSYRTVALTVQSTAFAAQGQSMMLENALLGRLRQQCGFEQVGRPGGAPADVVITLNITKAGRGGGGVFTNQSQAQLETLLVLADGQSGELLGTARIHGESGGMIINNASPENDAVEVVAKTVVDLLAKSGCSGPRVAKLVPAPPPDPKHDDTAKPVDESHRADAEALNEQGKALLFKADVQGAIAAFQKAVALVADARYQFNVCLAFGAGEQWDNAIAACKQARTMNPESRLADKIDHKLDLLQHRQ